MGGGGVNRVGPSGRGRGNFFIVDRKSRNVLWSVYERPKDSSPGELSRTAERIVKRLINDLSGKKQGAGRQASRYVNNPGAETWAALIILLIPHGVLYF